MIILATSIGFGNLQPSKSNSRNISPTNSTIGEVEHTHSLKNEYSSFHAGELATGFESKNVETLDLDSL